MYIGHTINISFTYLIYQLYEEYYTLLASSPGASWGRGLGTRLYTLLEGLFKVQLRVNNLVEFILILLCSL